MIIVKFSFKTVTATVFQGGCNFALLSRNVCGLDFTLFWYPFVLATVYYFLTTVFLLLKVGAPSVN